MLWNACTMEPLAALRWIECHPGLAGYLQVFGALLAIWIAYKAPKIAADHARREAERSRRLSTLDTIHMLDAPVAVSDSIGAKIWRDLNSREEAPGAMMFRDWFNEAAFWPLPPELSFLQFAHELDTELLLHHRNFFKAIQGYNALRMEVQNLGYTAVARDWQQMRESLKEAISNARGHASLIVTTKYPKT